MLIPLFAILLINSSCIYVPTPAFGLISQRGAINKKIIKSLKQGETTREDLLLLVGAPDAQYEQYRYFIYEWEATEGAFAHLTRTTLCLSNISFSLHIKTISYAT